MLALEIFRATQATYATVEHHMSSQLDKNMAQLEFDYYCDLVRGTSGDIDDKADTSKMTPEQIEFRKALDAIPAVAKEHNRTGMLNFGWSLAK